MEVPILKKIFALAEKYHKDVYAVVSNMSIAMERRDLIMKVSCLVCNDQEASMLFSEEYEAKTMEEMSELLVNKIQLAHIKQMVVTMGELGAVYA